MKKLFIFILVIFVLPSRLQAQTVYTVGASSIDFTNLQQAFDWINLGAVSGDIELQLIDNTTEPITAVINSSGGGVLYTSILIYPTAPGLSISGNINGPLIDLNGAENVFFDGRVNKTGLADLVIINSSTGASASTIRFIESANTNIVKYCKIQSAESGATGGVIFFSTSAAGTGNDNNIIDNNYISGDGSNRPVNAIYSLGSSGFENSGNTVSNNNIFNFLSQGSASNGILVDTYNDSWTISQNSFYETSSFVPTANVDYNIIKVNNAGVNYQVSQNNFGGQAANCGGSAWTKTNAFNNSFYAIWLNAGTGTASSIQNNTIRNFSWSNSLNAIWTGIHIEGGAVNAGTATGNTIGASTGTGSVIITGGTTNAYVYGINISGTGSVNCRNNIIGSITSTNTSAASATHFYGINKSNTAGTTTIQNNVIGSTTTSNSIQSTTSSSGNAQNLYGIYSNGSGAVTISGNTISNMYNGGTFTGTTGQTAGLMTRNGTNSISNNIVSNLSTSSGSTGTFDASVLIGVSQTSNLAGQTISGNTINNLSVTYSSSNAVNIIGINYAGGTSGTNRVEKNFIHSLSHSSSNVSSSIAGIIISAGASTFANNIISLGSGLLFNHAVTGIFENGAAGNDNSLYFNTVYIGGSPTSGSSNTFGIYSNANTNTRNFRNNLIANGRSNNGASGNHYALYVASTGGTIICDYNDYYTPGTGGVLGYFGADKTVLPIVTSQDANSKTINPLFITPGGTAPDDYQPSAAGLTAITGTGVLTDYNGASRSVTPTIGAFEAGSCTNPTSGGTIGAAQNGCSPFDPVSLTSTLPASGQTGAVLEYKWQISTTSSSLGFSDIASSNSASYDPGSLTQNTWYKRLARVTCTGTWTGAAESNVVLITVNSLPVANAITGGNNVCIGGALTLTSNATGAPVLTYIWSSSNTGVATVDNSGVVTPISVGSTNITYSVTDGSSSSCQATSPIHIVTVNALPIANPITGGNAVCMGGSLSLTPNATGSPVLTYTWSSTNTSVATVNNSGVVTPVSPGTTTIRYTVTDGSPSSCSAISAAYSVTVRALPVASAIAGGNSVCAGGTLNLTSNATGTPTLTYTWASSNPGVATVNNSGLVTALSGGTTNITYTVTDGTSTACQAISPVHVVTVNALPVAGAITGGNAVCMGGSLSLNPNATGTPTLTYVWTSSNTAVATVTNSGVVTPVSTGTTNISYTVTDGSSITCSASSPVLILTVNPLPVAGAITGVSSLCAGSNLPLTSNATGTGTLTYTWNSSNTSVATVNNSGVVSGVSAGTTNITYIVTDGTTSACQAISPVNTVTVNALPVAGAITGGNSVCAGGTMNLTSNATGSPTLTYTWASSNPAVATVNNSGVVSGVSAGTTNITYTVTDGSTTTCSSVSPVYLVTIISLPLNNLVVGGTGIICSGSSTNITVSSSVTGVNYQLRNASGNINIGAPIAGTGGTINLPTGNLTSTTTFNVLAINATTNCSSGLTETEVVTIDPATSVGTLSSGAGPYIYGGTTGNITLTGNTGTILKWQKMAPAGTWEDISNTTTTYSENPVSIGIWQYRVQIQSGSCPQAFTDPLAMDFLPKTLTITANNQTKSYGTSFSFLGTEFSSVGLINSDALTSVTLTSSGAVATASVSGLPHSIIPGSAVGTGLSNYTISYINGTLTVTKALITVDADDKSKIFGTPNPALTLTFTGWMNGEVETVLDVIPVATTIVDLTTVPGIYTGAITVAGGSDDNYNFTYLAGDFTVNKQNQTISFGSLPDKVYGSSDFIAPATSSSGLTVSFSSANTNVATISGNNIHITGAGTTTITATQSGNNNYNPATAVAQTLTIAKAPITFTADNKSRGYLAQNPVFTYSISGFVNSEPQSVLDVLPSIQTAAVQSSLTGTYPITLTGGNDNNYNYTFVAGTLTITKINQTISFSAVPEKLLVSDSYSLAATSTSGLQVLFESADNNFATISGNQITGISKGNVQVRAYNAGDQNYNAAETFATVEIYSTHKDIMNLFTPNNDGFNDYWELPELAAWGKCDVRVFNRWGKLVFANPDYNNLWDGTSNGSPLPEGPYYFIIDTENVGMVKGTVNIVR